MEPLGYGGQAVLESGHAECWSIGVLRQVRKAPRGRGVGDAEGARGGRDRVLARHLPDRDRNRGRVLIPEENRPLGGGTSSRRARTRPPRIAPR